MKKGTIKQIGIEKFQANKIYFVGINSCRHFVYGLIHSLQKFRWEEFFPLPFTERGRGGGMQVFEIPKVLGSLIVKVQCKSMQFSLFGELVLFEQM